MDENEPTPGPWMVFLNIQAGHTLYGVCTHTQTAIALDKDYWPEGHEPPTDEDGYNQPDEHADVSPHKIANARLISAAPDLLDVARMYEQWEADLIMCREAWRGGFADLPTLTQALWNRLLEIQTARNAAVRKAKGEQANG